MIRKTTAGIACALGCATAWAGSGVWSGQGPYGGYIFDIMQDPSTSTTLYTSTRSGIFKTIDGGGNWTPAMNGIVGSVSYGYPLSIAGTDTLYAVDSTGHVYKTTDGAANWLQTGYVLPPINGIPQINQIVDAPGSTTRLYMPTSASGILVSNDSGATFTASNGSGGTALPSAIPFVILAADPANPTNLLAGTGYTDQGPGTNVPSIFRSTDGGAHWTAAYTYPAAEFGGIYNPADPQCSGASPPPYICAPESLYISIYSISFGNGSEVYAWSDGGLLRSADGGASWSSVGIADNSVAGYTTMVSADPSSANSVYAGGYYGLKYSTDGGVHFSDVATVANGFTPNAADVATPSKLLRIGETWYLASQEAGLYKSTNLGGNWSRSDNGISATNIRALGMVPRTGLAPRVLAGYGDAFRPSTGIYAGIGTLAGDGDETWSSSDSGLRAYQIRAIAVDPSTASGNPASTVVYAGGRSEQINSIAPRNGGMYKSTDGGSTWTTIDNGIPLRTPFSGSPPKGSPFIGTVRSIVLDPSNTSTVYATANGCFEYTSIVSGAPNPPYPSLVGYCGSAINKTVNGATYDGSWRFRIFKSTDGGANWSSSDSNIPGSFIGTAPKGYADAESLLVVPLVIDPTNPSILYAGTSDSFADPTQITSPVLQTGIYRSSDGGATWSSVSNGLPTYSSPSTTVLGVLSMAIDPTTPTTLWASVIDINSSSGAPGHIYKTIDSGAHWTDSSVGMTSADIRALLVDPNSPTGSGRIIYAAGGGTAGNPGGVFKSYDAGATWHSISVGLPADAALALAISPVLSPAGDTKLYAGTSSGVWEMTQLPDYDHDGVPDYLEQQDPDDPNAWKESWVTYIPHPATPVPAKNSPNAPEVAFNDSNTSLPQPLEGATQCVQTQDAQVKSAAANGPDVITKNLDWRYDLDLLQFEILNCPTTTVTINYPNFTFGPGWSMRFYGPAIPGVDASIGWYDFSENAVKVGAHSWQITLTRGAFGSYRPESTGSILFQGGPGYDDQPFGNGFD